MTQQINQAAGTTAAPDTAAAPRTPTAPSSPPIVPKRRSGKKKMVKRIISLIVLLAIIGGIVFGLWYLVFRQDSTVGTPLTDVATIGSIQSVVEGSGNAVPMESAAITLNSAGTVQEVYVTVGQQVFAGDPLYTIDSQEARDKLADAQEKLDSLYKDLAALQEDAANLTVRAPFAGKLQDVKEFEIDQDVGKNQDVALLVNDKKLRLPLYFSYAYEGEIQVGQTVSVSIPSVMGNLDGVVEEINKVSYISPEGGVNFEAVIVFDNPGTLTAGMDASAVLTASDGSQILPYAMGKTEYYETRTIQTKAAGPVTGIGAMLMNHANVEEGEALLYLGSSTIDSDIRAKQEQIDVAQQDVDTAAEAMANFNAVAPIDGTVFSCTLEPGQNVKEGDTVITISNTLTMRVDIQVDSRNIGFIQAGMTMELTDEMGNPCMGTVTNVAMQGEVGTGVTTYPVQLTVDNSAGTIYNGSWLRYKLVTSESNDCILIPNQCVKRVTDVNGDIYTVVFVKADQKPENAIEMPESDPAMENGTDMQNKLPTTAEGFWPVPVTTGISDTYNVEIVEGLEVGTEVFTNRETNESYGY